VEHPGRGHTHLLGRRPAGDDPGSSQELIPEVVGRPDLMAPCPANGNGSAEAKRRGDHRFRPGIWSRGRRVSWSGPARLRRGRRCCRSRP